MGKHVIQPVTWPVFYFYFWKKKRERRPRAQTKKKGDGFFVCVCVCVVSILSKCWFHCIRCEKNSFLLKWWSCDKIKKEREREFVPFLWLCVSVIFFFKWWEWEEKRRRENVSVCWFQLAATSYYYYYVLNSNVRFLFKRDKGKRKEGESVFLTSVLFYQTRGFSVFLVDSMQTDEDVRHSLWPIFPQFPHQVRHSSANIEIETHIVWRGMAASFFFTNTHTHTYKK